MTVWAADEHRLGLLPVVRRVWAPRGRRPLAHVHRRYEWCYVYGVVRPATGQTWWCLLPTVSAAAFAQALTEFARDERIDPSHRAILVLDQAGWHTAKALPVPAGIDLVFLPAASPELQPAERLWPLVDEPGGQSCLHRSGPAGGRAGRSLSQPARRSPTHPRPYPLPLVAA